MSARGSWLKGLGILAAIAALGYGLATPAQRIEMRQQIDLLKDRLAGQAKRLDGAVTAPMKTSLADKLSSAGVARGNAVYIRIFKQSSELELWMKGAEGWALMHTYPICKWSGRLGPKLKESDKQSPEGFYRVKLGSLNPNSAYRLSFNLGFPNAFDRAHGRTGSFLMVHGRCSSIGCYAMTDEGIDEIYPLVEAALRAGQDHVPVHIFPFRMTRQALAAHSSSKWISYWRMLQPAYAAFERRRVPPKVAIRGKEYVLAGTPAG